MKKIRFLLLAGILFSTISQAYTQTALFNGMLFPRFEKGTVIYKNGQKINASFNYYTVKEQMQFLDEEEKILTFQDPSAILAVVINDRYFENAQKNIFYERIPVEKDYLYIRWKSKVISAGKRGAYGSQSQTAGINSYQLNSDGPASSLRGYIDEGIETTIECEYYLKQNGKWKKFNSLPSFLKIIEKHQKEIEEFVKQENISFKEPEDVKKLVTYYYRINS